MHLTKPLDDPSAASQQGGLTLSVEKLRLLEPGMFGVRYWSWKIVASLCWIDFETINVKILKQHLASGDSRAAVVVSTVPLLVAAYADDLDCVAMLRFPRDFAGRYQLGVGSRLLTINTYYRGFNTQADLAFGPNRSADWTGLFPVIAEFLSDDDRRIEDHKQRIAETEWQRCRELGEAYLFEHPRKARSGRPRCSHQPAGAVKEAVIAFSIVGLVVVVVCVVAWYFL